MDQASNASRKWIQMAESAGKAALSAIFPVEFELYALALELKDSLKMTKMYMTFPVMASSITESYPSRIATQQTLTGTYTVLNPNFSPRIITINGNFGKSFKLDSSAIATDLYGKIAKLNVWQRSYKGQGTPTFVPGIHTGYGYVKKLQMMLEESTTLSNGKPYSLYLYNLSLGENYQVVMMPQGINLSQNMSTNGIWNYSFSLYAIAPAFLSAGQKAKMLAYNLANNIVNSGTIGQTIKSIRK